MRDNQTTIRPMRKMKRKTRRKRRKRRKKRRRLRRKTVRQRLIIISNFPSLSPLFGDWLVFFSASLSLHLIFVSECLWTDVCPQLVFASLSPSVCREMSVRSFLYADD